MASKSLGLQKDLFRMVELFSGNGDIAERFKFYGWDALTVDFDSKKSADLHMDVYGLPVSFFEFFHFIWLSPDCTSYSLAPGRKYRLPGSVPHHDYAFWCDEHNAKLVELLKSSGKPFIMENPRAHMRHMPFVQGLYRWTVYYSVYGAPYSKPTDFFSNVDLSGYFDRSRMFTYKHLDTLKQYTDFNGRCKIPDALVDAICKAVIDYLSKENEHERPVD